MADPIPASVREFWDSWGIRLLIIFSLSLQIILGFFSSLRKKTGNMVVYFLIWSAYLLADWVPTFTTGLILNSVSTSTSTNTRSSISATGPGINNDLLALWAASLLWHVGGSYSITAFAFEDNELWFRNSIVMVAEFVTAIYIFLLTLPHNKLRLPTIFALIGGFFCNVLRVYSMRLASLDKYRNDIVKKPRSLDNARTTRILEKLRRKDPGEPLHRSDVFVVAHHYSRIFKGLVVDIKCQLPDQIEIQEVFWRRISSEDAYQLILCEVRHLHDVFYTNRIAFVGASGHRCSGISLISAAVVLSRFAQSGKQDFHHVDIGISEALVTVSFVLPYLMAYFIYFQEEYNAMLPVQWPNFARHMTHMPFRSFRQIQSISESIRLKESEIKIEPDIMHKIDNTPIFFWKWSESICSHNLISYCMKERPRVISWPYRPWVAWIFQIPHVAFQAIGSVFLFPGKLGSIIFRPVLDRMGLKDILDRAMYVSRDPIDKELWDFIFHNLRDASMNTEEGKLISEAIGSWALRDSNRCTVLSPYIEDVEYDKILLQWHIATELCYNTDDNNPPDREIRNNRIFSKMLSDYMLYLMVFQPSMMSTISSIFLRRYELTCNQISAFLGQIHAGGRDRKLKEACRSIFNSRAEFVQPDPENGDQSMALLSCACTLTEELKGLPEGERWTVLSRVWLEMLVYAARNCRGDIHARSLCRGGELLTLVWLLMAHFGLI